jgi:hypothetical protein
MMLKPCSTELTKSAHRFGEAYHAVFSRSIERKEEIPTNASRRGYKTYDAVLLGR